MSSWPIVSSTLSRPALSCAALFTLLTSACAMGPKAAQAPMHAGDSMVTEAEARPMRFARNAPAREVVAGSATAGGAAAQGMGAGQGQGQGPPPPAPPAPPAPGNTTTPATRAEPEIQKAVVVEGWVTLEAEEVPPVAEAIRTQVETLGGNIVSDQMSGGERSWSGHMKIKLPPEHVKSFLAWLAENGDITSKRIQGTDVSRTLFDQEIALENLHLTLDRMRKLLDRDGLEMKDILAIETEMTRLRGEIERIKGEKRFLEHRVAMATIDISLRRRAGVILGRAKAKFHPGARISTMILLDPRGRETTRLGGGLVVHTIPRLTLELDVFERVGSEPRAVLATFGGAFYSDFLGRGRRSFLNPYLGVRVGYGYLDGSAFVFAGTGGIELFKHEYVLIDATANVLGFARQDFDVAITASLSAVFAF